MKDLPELWKLVSGMRFWQPPSTLDDADPSIPTLPLFSPADDGTITATLSQTLGDVTLTATAKVATAGALAQTLGTLTSTATAKIATSAVLAQTLSDATLAGVMKNGIAAVVTQTLGTATITATAALGIRGTLTQTLGTLTLAGTGTVSQPGVISASLSQTLGDVTATATAKVGTGATLAQTLGLTLSATGTVSQPAGQPSVTPPTTSHGVVWAPKRRRPQKFIGVPDDPTPVKRVARLAVTLDGAELKAVARLTPIALRNQWIASILARPMH